MITYTATNTKTGKFYIGSAKNYCNYMNRKGNHHVGEAYSQFRKDLQEDPLAFTWDYSEDDLETRDFEFSLLQLYVGSQWCYNITTTSGFDTNLAKRANAAIKNRSRSEETRRKIGEGNRNPSSEKREALRQSLKTTNAKKSPCPQCGMLMNVGNLTKHLKGTRCKGKQQ
jgi:hypothetical protein